MQMDESVINGANLFFAPQFGIDPNATDGNAGRNQWLLGLVNSAPYVRHFLTSLVADGCLIYGTTSPYSSAAPFLAAGSPPRSTILSAIRTPT